FTVVDYGGARLVSKSYENLGVATVNRNFVRLTTDRQSKQGGISSGMPLRANEVTGHLEFRISGQAEKFFGDGLAIW
ncbi:unnamed protein product, partial [Heterosigma akashiwo]